MSGDALSEYQKTSGVKGTTPPDFKFYHKNRKNALICIYSLSQ